MLWIRPTLQLQPLRELRKQRRRAHKQLKFRQHQHCVCHSANLHQLGRDSLHTSILQRIGKDAPHRAICFSSPQPVAELWPEFRRFLLAKWVLKSCIQLGLPFMHRSSTPSCELQLAVVAGWKFLIHHRIISAKKDARGGSYIHIDDETVCEKFSEKLYNLENLYIQYYHVRCCLIQHKIIGF